MVTVEKIEKSAEKVVSADEAARVASVVDKATAVDPVLLNEMNAEPWYQSGVGIYGTGGILWALGAIIIQVAQHGEDYGAYDLNMMVTAVGSLVGFAAVLYRRFWPGLKPMFWWWSS